ncbi:uncharacterized protein K489DRAFT_382145 [Dissoconium aciculare CBS 342.82]|jgi:histone H3/H4|uniref:Apoptosis-inducing TAF9-like domain 1 family protein n=1 Tax=Dissoconium aciculare CBS 342.82 TaxID=1314786 RepID=A0A6J3M2G1_9PEZI|nr:uncharacterized protein K489DRAFT_382145 [Dissoconium aciculare CBS 342.82]KAF1821107.1 hypothetical protein K489DRAFT_382145 [Dissoconium aciculare CBS 342.82]
MAPIDAAEDEKQERLKAALWHAIGQTVDAIAMTEKMNASTRFIGSLSELVYEKINSAATDLEAFAKNSDRNVINAKDVVLLGRNNDFLRGVLQEQAKQAREQDVSKRR